MNSTFLQKTCLWAIALSIVGIGSMLLASTVHAVGISPALIDGGKLRRDNDVTKTVYISRRDPTAASYYKVTTEGEGARYIILETDLLEVPAGKNQAPFTFRIKPETAANGSYSARLSFTATDPPEKATPGDGAASVSILEGVIGKVQFAVTDEQIHSYSVVQVDVDDTEEALPVVLGYDLMNSGNVDTKPDRIEVSIIDLSDGSTVHEESVSADRLGVVPPAKRMRSTVALNKKLPIGMYYLSARFISNNQLVFERDNIRFEVFPAGTFARSAEFTKFKSNGESFAPGSLVRFDASIVNTGEVVVEPILFVDVKRNGESVELLRTDGRILRKGQDTTFTLTYRPEQAGNYTASAYFEYGIKRTDTRDVTFRIGGGFGLIHYIGIGVILLILFILVLLFLKKKRSGGTGAPPSSPPAQPPVQPPAASPPAQPPVQPPAVPPTPQPPAQPPVVPPAAPPSA